MYTCAQLWIQRSAQFIDMGLKSSETMSLEMKLGGLQHFCISYHGTIQVLYCILLSIMSDTHAWRIDIHKCTVTVCVAPEYIPIGRFLLRADILAWQATSYVVKTRVQTFSTHVVNGRYNCQSRSQY